MYSRFLKEASRITGNKKLENASKMINDSGKLFSEVGLLFKDSETVKDINERIDKASNLFEEIAEKEEVYNYLTNII